MEPRFRLTENEYQKHVDQYVGICRACAATRSGIEPGAHDRNCAACGQACVTGVEQLLVSGELYVDN